MDPWPAKSDESEPQEQGRKRGPKGDEHRTSEGQQPAAHRGFSWPDRIEKEAEDQPARQQCKEASAVNSGKRHLPRVTVVEALVARFKEDAVGHQNEFQGWPSERCAAHQSRAEQQRQVDRPLGGGRGGRGGHMRGKSDPRVTHENQDLPTVDKAIPSVDDQGALNRHAGRRG